MKLTCLGDFHSNVMIIVQRLSSDSMSHKNYKKRELNHICWTEFSFTEFYPITFLTTIFTSGQQQQQNSYIHTISYSPSVLRLLMLCLPFILRENVVFLCVYVGYCLTGGNVRWLKMPGLTCAPFCLPLNCGPFFSPTYDVRNRVSFF